MQTEQTLTIDNLPGDVARNAKQTAEILKKNLSFLSDLGYEMLAPSIRVTDTFKHVVQYAFVNPRLRRRLRIDYLPYAARTHERDDDVLFVSIRREPGMREKFSPSSDEIVPSFLFKARDPEFDTASMKISAHDGTFQEKVESVSQVFANAIRTHSKGIVEGRHWEFGHIPTYK